MKRLCLMLLLTAVAAVSPAQNPDQEAHPRLATITYHRVWEPAIPQEFTVKTTADGASTYVSRNPLKAQEPGEEKEPDLQLEFTMSARNQARIFKLAEQANFFKGSFDFTKHPIANTGKKTLTFADQSRFNETTYNYSENKAIEELTNIFQGISNTIEFGRRLQFKHKYDKLGLEAELKAMEDTAASQNLAEIQVIEPTLKSIAEDSSVLNIARQRATRLLKASEK